MMISAVILTKNERKNIKRCLRSLFFCSEIVVIDDYSTDRTLGIIKSASWRTKVKIFQRHLNKDFAAQRNYGLGKATGEWVLFVDPDEVVSEALASEISNFKFQISNYDGFYLKRCDIIWGRELLHGETGNVKLLRLARKGSGLWKRRVHEYWDIKGETAGLNNPLLHYPHPTVEEFISHINFYSTLHAKQKWEDDERSNLLKIYLWPKFKFLKNYFLKLGFLDGTAGFVQAMMMSFHSFLAWSKLWLLERGAR